MVNRIQGFATPEGTARFQSRFEDSLAPGHFRADFQHLVLSSIGMGTYLGEPDAETDQQMCQAVIQSVGSGAVNIIDTAINYRYQASERSIADALKQLIAGGTVQRDEVFVASKNGFLTPDAAIHQDFRTYFEETFIQTGIVRPEDIASGCHCMSPSYLQDQLERSLANLGLETLDLLYLHNAAESQLPAVGREEFMERLKTAFVFYETARQQGKIRFYGMATWSCFRIDKHAEDAFLNLETVVQLAESIGGKDSHGFRYIQLPYNFAMMEALTVPSQRLNGAPVSLLQAACELGMGVFTSIPLLQGQLLTQPLPNFQGCETHAQACLQMARSTPGILAPLVGHKQSSHVSENLAVANIPMLSTPEFDSLFAVTTEA